MIVLLQFKEVGEEYVREVAFKGVLDSSQRLDCLRMINVYKGCSYEFSHHSS